MFSNRPSSNRRLGSYLRRAVKKLSEIPAWAEATVLLLSVRVALARLRYPTLLQWLEKSAHKLRAATAPEDAERQVLRAIHRARRFGVGNISCLEEALSIQWMLRRRSVEAHLRIGVRRTDDNQLLGHAWIESGGEIVSIDQQSPASYVVLSNAATRLFPTESTTTELSHESHRRHRPI
jgi:hypothetical protein